LASLFGALGCLPGGGGPPGDPTAVPVETVELPFDLGVVGLSRSPRGDLIAGGARGLYRSTDDGETFEELVPGLDWSSSAATSRHAFVMGAHVLHRIDLAEPVDELLAPPFDPQPRTEVVPPRLAVTDDDVVVVALRSETFASADEGDTWYRLGEGSSTFFGVTGSRLWLSTSEGFVTSDDGGRTFEPRDPRGLPADVRGVVPLGVASYLFYGGRELLRTDDDGESYAVWAGSPDPLTLDFPPFDRVVRLGSALVGSSSFEDQRLTPGTYVSEDEGRTWARTSAAVLSGAVSFTPEGATPRVVASFGSRLAVTEDARAWRAALGPHETAPRWMAAAAGRLWLADSWETFGVVHLDLDTGVWRVHPEGHDDYTDVALGGPIAAHEDGSVATLGHFSEDGGETWRRAGELPPGDWQENGLVAVPGTRTTLAGLVELDRSSRVVRGALLATRDGVAWEARVGPGPLAPHPTVADLEGHTFASTRETGFELSDGYPQRSDDDGHVWRTLPEGSSLPIACTPLGALLAVAERDGGRPAFRYWPRGAESASQLVLDDTARAPVYPAHAVGTDGRLYYVAVDPTTSRALLRRTAEPLGF
jgi:hypothetical protein